MANLFVERTIGLVRLLPPPIERVTLQGVDSTPNDSATGTLPRDSEGRRLFAAAFGRERIDRAASSTPATGSADPIRAGSPVSERAPA